MVAVIISSTRDPQQLAHTPRGLGRLILLHVLPTAASKEVRP
jgi:hypothetical protein